MSPSPGGWRRGKGMAEAFSSPSSCLALRIGQESSSLLSSSHIQHVPAHVLCQAGALGRKFRDGSTAGTLVCSGQQQWKSPGSSRVTSGPCTQLACSIAIPFLPGSFLSIVAFIAQRVLSPQDSCRGCCFAHHYLKKISLVKKSCQPLS